jgi:hypothetical protein
MAFHAGLPVPNPTCSFWIDTPVADSLATEGNIPTDADICIIGSGATGVSSAYHLANDFALDGDSDRSPIKAVILEAREFCEHCQPPNIYYHRVRSSRLWGDRSIALLARKLLELMISLLQDGMVGI